ncbi:uncharacterized protein METZ01_LOCUS391134 [marine metagenome]|uniref:Uncharacterized protein n=1 Tax=marine metagenome TaxID=408172 RepID=A0A382UVQ9_9ZZZZ
MFNSLNSIFASVVLPVPGAPLNNKCGIDPDLIQPSTCAF